MFIVDIIDETIAGNQAHFYYIVSLAVWPISAVLVACLKVHTPLIIIVLNTDLFTDIKGMYNYPKLIFLPMRIKYSLHAILTCPQS